MHALRKNLCWTFAITSLICTWIVIASIQPVINRYHAFPPLRALLVPTLFTALAVVFALTWWTIWKGRPSARGWGIAASLINVLVSLFPIALSSDLVWRCSGVTLPIGIAGLIAYSRRDQWSPLAANAGEAASVPGRRLRFRTIATIAACAAVICGAAISLLVFKQKAAERHLTEVANVCRVKAEQGDEAAQSSLGYKYLRGEGVRQDYTEAVRWYRKAAEKGYAKGEYNLGYMYAHGYGLSQDYAEAARLYRDAADQGDSHAQNNLGLLYFNGQGVQKDSAEADRWFQKAADQGDEYAKRTLRQENPAPSSKSKILPWLVLGGSLWLLTGSSAQVWGFPDWRRRVIPLSLGILGISFAGLSFYETAHNPMRNSVFAANAFYMAKGLLIGVSGIVALSISPKSEGPEETLSCDDGVEASETNAGGDEADSL